MSNKAHSRRRSTKSRICIFLFIAYLIALTYLYFGNFNNFQQEYNLPLELYGIPLDKIVHFIMFLPFPFLAHGSYTGQKKFMNLLYIFFFGLVIAYCFELFQSKITSSIRTTDPWDLVVNIASLTFATFLMSIIDLCRR